MAELSLGVFHGQEYERFEILRNTVDSSLRMLAKAIKGLVVMSAELEDMFNCFNIQKVPINWDKQSYPSLAPLNSYFRGLVDRLDFINDWLTLGPPDAYWVSGLFFPQGFMTASMQVYARATRIAIDTLAFSTDVTNYADKSELTAPPEKGGYIYGIYLQGCGFDIEKQALRESSPGVLLELFPVVHLCPVMKDDLDTSKDYMCPLYKTSERRGVLSTTGHSTNFVLFFNIPQDKTDIQHWTRRGVCLLCMLDD